MNVDKRVAAACDAFVPSCVTPQIHPFTGDYADMRDANPSQLPLSLFFTSPSSIFPSFIFRRLGAVPVPHLHHPESGEGAFDHDEDLFWALRLPAPAFVVVLPSRPFPITTTPHRTASTRTDTGAYTVLQHRDCLSASIRAIGRRTDTHCRSAYLACAIPSAKVDGEEMGTRNLPDKATDMGSGPNSSDTNDRKYILGSILRYTFDNGMGRIKYDAQIKSMDVWEGA